MLGRHVLLLRLDEPELALVAVALGVELVPLAGLLHELRLQLRRRQRLGALRRPGRRRRGRGLACPGPRRARRRRGRRHVRRRRGRRAVPHRRRGGAAASRSCLGF